MKRFGLFIFILCTMVLFVGCNQKEEVEQEEPEEPIPSAFELGIQALENEDLEDSKK